MNEALVILVWKYVTLWRQSATIFNYVSGLFDCAVKDWNSTEIDCQRISMILWSRSQEMTKWHWNNVMTYVKIEYDSSDPKQKESDTL